MDYSKDLNDNGTTNICRSSKQKEYQPFEPKAKEDTVVFQKRKAKWNKQLKDEVTLDHRRFNVTLTVNQIVTSFKRCVRGNEVKRDALMTCYRVVLEKILQDPELTDNEFISLYKVIQPRANEVYSRRARNMKRVRG